MSNPYQANNPDRHFKLSVVCFLDLLGYQSTFGTGDSSTHHEAFVAMHTALTEARGWLDWAQDDPSERPYEINTFTDNIVIGWPIHEDGELELGLMMDGIQNFQFSLVTNGVFVRGAVSVGELYMDELGVFGPGLLDAYKGESQLAVDPRVVLTKSARERVQQHLQYYPHPESAPHTSDILRDSDGQWFINYLEALWPAPEYGPDLYQLERHQKVVSARLATYSEQPRLWSKYEWVARYHNRLCAGEGLENYTIAIDDLRASIKSIIPG